MGSPSKNPSSFARWMSPIVIRWRPPSVQTSSPLASGSERERHELGRLDGDIANTRRKVDGSAGVTRVVESSEPLLASA